MRPQATVSPTTDTRTSAFGALRQTYDPAVASEINRAFWDERVPIHTASAFYDVEGFKAGREQLEGFELEALGDVSGRSLVHLQCHFGLGTLAWARHGARVTGL